MGPFHHRQMEGSSRERLAGVAKARGSDEEKEDQMGSLNKGLKR